MLYVWLFKLTGFLPLMFWFRPRVRGRENLPKEPCILAMNHGAAMDPVLINAVFPVKRIYMLTAERLFHTARINQMQLRWMGCRPSVSPSGDMETMAEIAGRLRRYEMIGFFSEGKIQNSVGSFRSGAVMLALRTGLPLVPVYLHTASVFKGGSRISFGEPVRVSPDQSAGIREIEELSEEIRNRVIELSDR